MRPLPPAVLVAAGGAVGAGLRWGAGELIAPAGSFPWATLVVNLLGCAAIGCCVRWVRDAQLWALVVTGALGGFTTFSSFAVEVRGLVADGRSGAALLYVVASVGGGLTATRLTAGSGRRRSREVS